MKQHKSPSQSRHLFYSLGILALAGIQDLKAQSIPPIEFILINADSNKAIGTLVNKQTIQLNQLPTQNISIQAKVASSLAAKSVKLSLNSHRRTENEAPFAMFGDSKGDYNAGKLSVGSAKVGASAYSRTGGNGNLLAKYEITLNITSGSTLPKDCGTLAHGATTTEQAYPSQTVPFGQLCIKDTFSITCNNGSLIKTPARYATCSVLPNDNLPLACTLPEGGSLASGATQTRIRYQAASVPEGQSCVNETQRRSCSNGVLSNYSGTFAAANCYVEGRVGGKQPMRVSSFGPNGTHWPELIPTPFMYERDRSIVPNIIEVDANWDAIEKAIDNVTDAQANAGTLLLVKPNQNLAGRGNSTPSIEKVGSKNWRKRVTLAPRDGFGSVVFTGTAKFLQVYGVAFAGFKADSIKCQACGNSALAWIKATGYLGVHGLSGENTENVELVEYVMPNHYVNNGDTADVYTGGGNINNWRVDGSYFAPRFFQANYTGGKPHTDTFQFASTSGGGSYGNITLRDSAFFSSNNCSIQTGNIKDLSLDHSYVVSGAASLARYPHLSGGATEATTNAFNGSGANFRAKDSVIIGGMALNDRDSTRPWASVSNTRTSKAYGSLNTPQVGQWTVVSNLSSVAPLPPMPTDSFLENIWRKPYVE